MSDLKPCPFCGVEDGDHDGGLPFLRLVVMPGHRTHSGPALRAVRCNNCDCLGPRIESPEIALDLWNTRATDTTSDADNVCTQCGGAINDDKIKAPEGATLCLDCAYDEATPSKSDAGASR